MLRSGLTLLVAMTGVACLGMGAGMLTGDRTSEAVLSMEEGVTEASQGLLAFDPARHRMEITISIAPLDQPDDLQVAMVTPSGTRFQVLGSFHLCVQDGDRRRCPRELPALPSEEVGPWRVEAMRGGAAAATSVRVEVEWVPLDT